MLFAVDFRLNLTAGNSGRVPAFNGLAFSLYISYMESSMQKFSHEYHFQYFVTSLCKPFYVVSDILQNLNAYIRYQSIKRF